MAWTSPYTVVGGTAVLASWANSNVRDNELYLYTQANHQGQFVYGSTIGSGPITSDLHNWNPDGLSTANVVRVDPSALWEITGVQYQTHGTFFWMINGSGGTLRIKHGDTRSGEYNRITTNTLADHDATYLSLTAWLYLYGGWRVKV